jgi:hypothetical protein
MGKPEGKRDHLEDRGVDARAMFKYTLNDHAGKAWSGLIRLGIRKSGGLW